MFTYWSSCTLDCSFTQMKECKYSASHAGSPYPGRINEVSDETRPMPEDKLRRWITRLGNRGQLKQLVGASDGGRQPVLHDEYACDAKVKERGPGGRGDITQVATSLQLPIR